MQCKELEAVLAEDGLSPLSPAAQAHVAGCAACRDLLADFSAIVAAAQHLPKEVNPPDRIWVAVRTQLEAEGIIREAEFAKPMATASWWSGFSELFRPRALAMAAAAAFLIAGSIYLVERPKTGPGPTVTTPTAKAPEARTTQTARNEAPALVEQAVSPKREVSVAHSTRVSVPPQPRESHTELAPSPTENAYFGDSAAVLSETENALPTRRLADNVMVDAALRNNLRTLNEFIAECEARLKQNPEDQLTRDYLNMAYQQKAELLTAMMDSGRSEH